MKAILKLDLSSPNSTHLNSVRSQYKSMHSISSTSYRGDQEFLFVCNNQMCCLNKLQIARLKSEILKLELDKENLQSENLLQRQQLCLKNNDIIVKQGALKNKITIKTNELNQNEQEMIRKMSTLEANLVQLQNSELEALERKQSIEQNIIKLHKQEKELSGSVEMITQREVENAQANNTLQELIKNSQSHVFNLQHLEQRLNEKCKKINEIFQQRPSAPDTLDNKENNNKLVKQLRDDFEIYDHRIYTQQDYPSKNR